MKYSEREMLDCPKGRVLWDDVVCVLGFESSDVKFASETHRTMRSYLVVTDVCSHEKYFNLNRVDGVEFTSENDQSKDKC